MNTDNRPVTITCEACYGEGRMYRGTYEDERDLGPCPECNGTARVEVPSEPATLEDVSDLLEATTREFWARLGVARAALARTEGGA